MSVNWIDLSQSAGTGNATVGVSASTNPSAFTRNAVLRVSVLNSEGGEIIKHVFLSQSAAPFSIEYIVIEEAVFPMISEEGGSVSPSDGEYVIRAYYNDGTNEIIESGYTVTGNTVSAGTSYNPNITSAGTMNITVSYSGVSATTSVIIYQDKYDGFVRIYFSGFEPFYVPYSGGTSQRPVIINPVSGEYIITGVRASGVEEIIDNSNITFTGNKVYITEAHGINSGKTPLLITAATVNASYSGISAATILTASTSVPIYESGIPYDDIIVYYAKEKQGLNPNMPPDKSHITTPVEHVFCKLSEYDYNIGMGIISFSGVSRINLGDFTFCYGDWPGYSDNNNLLKIIINTEVETHFGTYDFKKCTALSSITIGDSVVEIGRNAFESCTALSSITIPQNVTMTGYSTFLYCDALTSITFENGINVIPNYTFYGCTLLQNQNISGIENVTNIGMSAFTNCVALTGISTNSLTSIGNGAFQGCSLLTTVKLGSGLTSINDGVFDGCISLSSITLPNTVTSIGANSFNGCVSLTSITLPNNITSIGDWAFANSGLIDITVPDGTTLGGGAFANCSYLTSAILPSDLNVIDYSLFSGCTSLQNTSIPNGVTTINHSAFQGCISLTSITIPNSVTTIDSWFDEGTFQGCTALSSITIPDSVVSIGDCTFKDCTAISSITIGSGLTRIGQYVFANCIPLSSITIPETVIELDAGVFSGCTSLVNVNIPTGITYIARSLFEGCTSLYSTPEHKFIIPNSVNSNIFAYAFAGCTSLTNVYFNGTKAQWNYITRWGGWNCQSILVVYCTDDTVVYSSYSC